MESEAKIGQSNNKPNKLKNTVSDTTIEDLYKYFGILSEMTKDNAEQVKILSKLLLNKYFFIPKFDN